MVGKRPEMIYLRLCRIGYCEICTASFYLTAGMEIPEKCPACGSSEWEWGVEPLDGIRVRMQIRKVSKPINPGAKSLARQERGRKQWRRFLSKEENDALNAKQK